MLDQRDEAIDHFRTQPRRISITSRKAGISTDDPDSITTGIETHLQDFRETAAFREKNIDFRAVATINLARQYGYEIDIRSPNVPEALVYHEP